MRRMVGKQIYIEPELADLLKQRAEELGISEADLIRRCINQLTQGSVTLPLDSKAWQEEMAYIRERTRTQKAHGKQRTWTCGELYEQRLGTRPALYLTPFIVPSKERPNRKENFRRN